MRTNLTYIFINRLSRTNIQANDKKIERGTKEILI